MTPTQRDQVLHVLIVVTSTRRRGAQIEGSDLAAQLRERGVDAEAVALTSADADQPLKLKALGRSTLGWGSLRALRRRARDVDVVVAYGSSTLTACALALLGSGVPFVYRSIGDPAEWVRGRLHQATWKVLYRRAHRIVALWPGGERSVRELFGISADRVHVIPNARDELAFVPAASDARAAARQLLGISTGAKVVAIIGSLSEEKQVGHAIQAIGRLPGMELVVAGDGPLRSELEEHARTVAPGRVRFLGYVDGALEVLHAADVLVLTSRTEGMPGVVIEAGLCGVPAVAPAVGAVEVLIDHTGTGIVTESPDPENIAHAIESLLPNAVATGVAARAHMVTKFSWTSVAPQWVKFLGEAVPVERQRSHW